MSELELSQEHLERNDEVFNAVRECICKMLEEEEIPCDISMVESTFEAIRSELSKWGHKVRMYEIEIDEKGNQKILSGLE